MSIRIMLADDHQMVREGIKALLKAETDMEVVAEASTGSEAVELATREAPDVIVMDVTMPELNGVEAMRRIRQVAPETEVIALSMHGAHQVIEDMLRAGASGYILKSASVQELAKAIRMVMSGQTYLSEEVREVVDMNLRREKASTRIHEEVCRELTPRECEVLKLVAEGKSSKEIAEALYVSTKTIVWHRQSIMDKLGVRSVAELTKYAVRMGLTAP